MNPERAIRTACSVSYIHVRERLKQPGWARVHQLQVKATGSWPHCLRAKILSHGLLVRRACSLHVVQWPADSRRRHGNCPAVRRYRAVWAVMIDGRRRLLGALRLDHRRCHPQLFDGQRMKNAAIVLDGQGPVYTTYLHSRLASHSSAAAM